MPHHHDHTMPHRLLHDVLFALPPYLFGVLGWISTWGQEHPIMYLFAIILGPALGVAVRWLLNRYQSSAHMWRQARAYRQRVEAYCELFGPLPGSIEDRLEPEEEQWGKVKRFWRRLRRR